MCGFDQCCTVRSRRDYPYNDQERKVEHGRERRRQLLFKERDGEGNEPYTILYY